VKNPSLVKDGFICTLLRVRHICTLLRDSHGSFDLFYVRDCHGWFHLYFTWCIRRCVKVCNICICTWLLAYERLPYVFLRRS